MCVCLENMESASGIKPLSAGFGDGRCGIRTLKGVVLRVVGCEDAVRALMGG